VAPFFGKKDIVTPVLDLIRLAAAAGALREFERGPRAVVRLPLVTEVALVVADDEVATSKLTRQVVASSSSSTDVLLACWHAIICYATTTTSKKLGN
jgi:hypothetical protein